MTRRELAAVVSELQTVLYVMKDGRYDPDKEWNSETLDSVAGIMDRHRLIPH